MVKFVILPRRKPSLSQEAFVSHHQDRHAPLFCALPEVMQHVGRYAECHTVPASIPGMPPVTFDGITELWFDDPAGLKAEFSSQSYMQTIRPDEAALLNLEACEFVLSAETVMIPAGATP